MVFAAIVSTPAWAAVIAPAGLNPGDSFRLVFVTSTTTQATNTSIAYYDNFVTTRAVAAGLDTYDGSGVSWHVLGSTAAVSALSRDPATGSSSPIYKLNGVLIATSGADLWDGNIASPLDINELMNTLVTAAWTGTDSNGVTNNPLGTATPSAGVSNFTNATWMIGFGAGNNNNLALYAISETMTVPAPEPATMAVLGVGLGAYGWPAADAGPSEPPRAKGPSDTNVKPGTTIASPPRAQPHQCLT